MQYYDYHYPKMQFAQPVRDKIARVIGTYFSTKEIESVFADVNIETASRAKTRGLVEDMSI